MVIKLDNYNAETGCLYFTIEGGTVDSVYVQKSIDGGTTWSDEIGSSVSPRCGYIANVLTDFRLRLPTGELSNPIKRVLSPSAPTPPPAPSPVAPTPGSIVVVNPTILVSDLTSQPQYGPPKNPNAPSGGGSSSASEGNSAKTDYFTKKNLLIGGLVLVALAVIAKLMYGKSKK